MEKKVEVATSSDHLELVYNAILSAIQQVSSLLRYGECTAMPGINAFGDQQLTVDVASNDIIYASLKNTKLVAYALSEEKPTPTELGGSEFIVTLDPLDGSSVIATNFSVGSIFGIWPNKNKLIGLSGKDMIGAIVAVYGPRTQCVLYNHKLKQVDELRLGKSGASEAWIQSKSKLRIKETTKLFAPGNLRATTENKGYKEVVDFWFNSVFLSVCCR